MTRWKHPTAEEIQRATASYFNITYSGLLMRDHHKEFARPRQIAMYLTRELTNYSLPKIGMLFAGRHHTTVYHAVQVIGGLLEKHDPVIVLSVREIRREFVKDEK